MIEVTWYPAFLAEVGSDISEIERVSFLKKLFETMKNPTKMNIAPRLYSMPKLMACMRNDPRSLTVDIYGTVFHCEHLVGRAEKSIVSIDVFDDEKNLARREFSIREECLQCVFLPKCMGGCAVNLETNDLPV